MIHYGLSPVQIEDIVMWKINHMIDEMNRVHKSGKGCHRCGIPSDRERRMMR